MKQLSLRAGATLLEVLLFLGILSIMATTITSVFIATQDARAQQRAVANLEAAGTQLLSHMTKTIRRAEAVVTPASNQTGTTLVLQMATNDEFPTIFTRTGCGLTLVQKSETSSLLNPEIRISSLSFRNVAGSNVWFSFRLTTTMPTLQKRLYSRIFNGTATLFPDDQSDAGGCGSCPEPACITGAYTWYICASDICTQSDTTLPC